MILYILLFILEFFFRILGVFFFFFEGKVYVVIYLGDRK